MATNKIEIKFRNGYDTKSAHGSGFWIRTGEDLVFATNRHVIDIEYKDAKYIREGYELCSMRIILFNKQGNRFALHVVQAKISIPEDQDVDIALLEITFVRNPDKGSVTPAEISIVADASFLHTQLEWGAQVSFTSFQPWRDTESDRPILRTGILSSDPAYPFASEKIGRKKIHLLEAFSFAGSSGSPVIANARGIQTDGSLSGGNFRAGKIIGIMAGHIQNDEDGSGALHKAHTGLSYCQRSDLLLDMINGSEPLGSSTLMCTDTSRD